MSDSLSHIGIAVDDIDQAIETFRRLSPDLTVRERVEVPQQGVEVCFLDFPKHPGLGRLELLRGLSPDSPVSRFVAKRGEGLHHICFGCQDINARLAELKEQGVELVDSEARIGALGKLIAFIRPESAHGALVEFEED